MPAGVLVYAILRRRRFLPAVPAGAGPVRTLFASVRLPVSDKSSVGESGEHMVCLASFSMAMSRIACGTLRDRRRAMGGRACSVSGRTRGRGAIGVVGLSQLLNAQGDVDLGLERVQRAPESLLDLGHVPADSFWVHTERLRGRALVVFGVEDSAYDTA